MLSLTERNRSSEFNTTLLTLGPHAHWQAFLDDVTDCHKAEFGRYLLIIPQAGLSEPLVENVAVADAVERVAPAVELRQTVFELEVLVAPEVLQAVQDFELVDQFTGAVLDDSPRQQESVLDAPRKSVDALPAKGFAVLEVVAFIRDHRLKTNF